MTSSTTDRRLGLTGSSALKAPVLAASTANLTLSGEQTVDGVHLVTGNRVLVKNQTSPVDNGIYEVDTSSWTRTKDFDGANDVVTGTLVYVINGSSNIGTFWQVTNTGTITPGSTLLTFSLINVALSGLSTLAQTLVVETTAAQWLTTLGFSAFVQTLIDDTTAQGFLTTLGVTSTVDELNGADISAKVSEKDDATEFRSPYFWSAQFVGTDPSIRGLVNVDGQNGLARMSTGADATGTMAVNGISYTGGLNWKASGGSLVWEMRVQLSAITNVCVFIGFTDQNTVLEMPFTLAAGDALTSNASDAVGVLFDTGADTDHWFLVGVKADADATKQDSGVSPVANTLETWRIELSTSGVATFYRNGTVIGTAMANAVTSSIALARTFSAFSRTSTSINADYDYVMVQGTRV